MSNYKTIQLYFNPKDKDYELYEALISLSQNPRYRSYKVKEILYKYMKDNYPQLFDKNSNNENVNINDNTQELSSDIKSNKDEKNDIMKFLNEEDTTDITKQPF